MLYAIIGNKGQGKTLLMTKLLIDWSKNMKRPPLANYKLFDIPFEYITEIPTSPNEFLELMRDRVVAFSEMHFWLDCRSSASKRSKLMTSVSSLSRHSGTKFLYDSQAPSVEWFIMRGKVDHRVKTETNFIARALACLDKYDNVIPPENPERIKPWFVLTDVYDMAKGKKIRYKIFVRNVVDMYDTNELMKLPEG